MFLCKLGVIKLAKRAILLIQKGGYFYALYAKGFSVNYTTKSVDGIFWFGGSHPKQYPIEALHGPTVFHWGCRAIRIPTSISIPNGKSTIDEGFFAYFFHLEGKKQGQAGEAIKIKYIWYR